jgi:prolyl oligopeptidase
MFIVQRKDLDASPHLALLTGYGGFNLPMLPGFAATWFPWLERGGIIAMPNLRGGGEFGRDWHESGMGQKKQNVFDDFIGAAEHLIAEGYTTSAQLAISGRSNGGLLVGAAMTQRPELFGAVLCGVPVLDMLRFHRVGVGSAWVPEYGDVTNEGDFRALFAYSPYHRLETDVRYPPTLMLSADADDRVDPMHARKFVARLLRSTEARAWLRVERHAGHGGADMRKRLIERTADEYAFLLDVLVSRPQAPRDSASP